MGVESYGSDQAWRTSATRKGSDLVRRVDTGTSFKLSTTVASSFWPPHERLTDVTTTATTVTRTVPATSATITTIAMLKWSFVAPNSSDSPSSSVLLTVGTAVGGRVLGGMDGAVVGAVDGEVGLAVGNTVGGNDGALDGVSVDVTTDNGGVSRSRARGFDWSPIGASPPPPPSTALTRRCMAQSNAASAAWCVLHTGTMAPQLKWTIDFLRIAQPSAPRRSPHLKPR